MANYSNDHSSESGLKKKKSKKLFCKFTYCYTYMPIYGSKFRNLGGSKKSDNFMTAQKSALFEPANSQLVTYSKSKPSYVEYPRAHLWTDS